MLQLRKQQIKEIASCSRKSFQSRVVQALSETDCQAEVESLSNSELRNCITIYWDEATRYSIRTERDVYEFIRLKFRKDAKFWGSGAVTELEEWLSSPFVPSWVKINKLLQLSSDTEISL